MINKLSKELGKALAEGDIKKAMSLKGEITQLKKHPKLELKRVEIYSINSKLKKVLTKLVNEWIAKEARKDALFILNNCTEKTVMEFLFFALKGDGNLACLCLDFGIDKNNKPIITKSFNRKNYE